ncbi:MAG TPA: choice-of-anchor tandem repeat GloVer-containing protein [Rhizomicrobium sp.]|jgi:uncharacterized repeat protein (TIGR03803 family)|nr:choice-of-anchor tandem repeat GloVer-containing protein [Rhizomicrobium sp.]
MFEVYLTVRKLGFALAVTYLALPGPAQSNNLKVLYGFDGIGPTGPLVTDNHGRFYGTTQVGGANGAGSVFSLYKNRKSHKWTEKSLYSFCSVAFCADGYIPGGTVSVDSSGIIYGTTYAGGTRGCGYNGDGCGVVYKLTPDGTETVLHAFTNGSDGSSPYAPPIADGSGNLYGTTALGGGTGCGGLGCGIVYEISANGHESVLHAFTGGDDGSNPYFGVLTFDDSGNVVGTTILGGENDEGTVFKVSPSGTESIMYSFDPTDSGHNPEYGLISDAAGNFYGATPDGGVNGAGVVFSLSPNGSQTVLYSFSGGSDGASPSSALVFDAQGNLYGTTLSGGIGCAKYLPGGCGTVFKLSPQGRKTTLHTFHARRDGKHPSGVIINSSGSLLGTTPVGGSGGGGTAYEITP